MQEYIDFIEKHQITLGMWSVMHRENLLSEWSAGSQHFKVRIRAGDTVVWVGEYTYGSAHDINTWDCQRCLLDVLPSLQLDAGDADQPFEDWAIELGYDPDSRKAYKIWEACQAIRHTLRKHLGETVFNEFMGLEE